MDQRGGGPTKAPGHPNFTMGGGESRPFKSSNTGFKQPSYSSSNTVSEKRNTAATGAQKQYQSGGSEKVAGRHGA